MFSDNETGRARFPKEEGTETLLGGAKASDSELINGGRIQPFLLTASEAVVIRKTIEAESRWIGASGFSLRVASGQQKSFQDRTRVVRRIYRARYRAAEGLHLPKAFR
jgi:hypothetical protein